MTKEFTSNTFSETYRDDYDPTKGFHRILFNSGKALQARELTQLQTLIQEEIKRFGNHVFKEGASVNAGPPSTIIRDYIKLSETLISDEDKLALINTTFVVRRANADTGIRVKILSISESLSAEEPLTFYVNYVGSGDQETDTTSPVYVQPGDTLTDNNGHTYTVQLENTDTNPAIGNGTFASINTGVYFALGHFVYTDSETINISRYTDTINGYLGFVANQDIVTVLDDESLYDNAGTVYNESSPGADRYRIKLNLTFIEQTFNEQGDETTIIPENFIQIATIKRSVIEEHTLNNESKNYNKLGDTLAVRTAEEAGNYVVDKFILSVEDRENNDAVLDFVFDPGIAYVNGYRVHTKGNTIIDVNKPRTTIVKTNEGVSVNYGNYVLTKATIPGDPNDINVFPSARGLPNIDNIGNIFVKDANGDIIGTTRVRALQKDGEYIRAYLQDFFLHPNHTEAEMRYLAISNAEMLTVYSTRKDVSSSKSIFPLPKSRVAGVSQVAFTAQKEFNVTANQNGSFVISLPTDSEEIYTDINDWIVSGQVSSNQSILEGAVITLSSNAKTATISHPDIVATRLYEGISYVKKDSSDTSAANPTKAREKTLEEENDLFLAPTGDIIKLKRADLVRAIQIVDPTLDQNDDLTFDGDDIIGSDISHLFDFDNGQRDDHYDYGRLYLKAGETMPANVAIRYQYFSHSDGDYFSINSYASLDYKDIPTYTTSSGIQYRLSDVLDFRPVPQYDYEEDITSVINDRYKWRSGNTGIVNELPKNGTTITVDASYYLGKKSIAAVKESGELIVYDGVPSEDPKFPQIPNEALALYHIEMAPYVLSSKDIAITQIESKRYTMKDIGKLEDRLARLEEITSLNMLEMATSTFTVLDNNGNIRSKTGFFVDNFADQSRSHLANGYSAAIDPSRGLMRAAADTKAIRMVPVDREDGVNTKIKGDNLYLDYEQVSYINQPLITGFENVNPYSVVTKRGLLTISPASDSWMETRYDADRFVQGDDKFSVDQSSLWDNWNWNWTGNETIGTTLGSQVTSSNDTWGRTTRGNQISSESTTSGRTTTTVNTFETTQSGVRTVNTAAAVVTGFSTVNEQIDDKFISNTLLPKMRSQKINFKAEGLRPNTRYFAFFGGKDVTKYIKIDNTQPFEYITDDIDDYSKGYENIEEYPSDLGGKTDIIKTDESGALVGSFFLPMTDKLSFKAGEKELKFLDISEYDQGSATSWAATSYVSKGTLQTRQRTILSTRTVNISTETTTERTNLLRTGIETDTTVSTRRRGNNWALAGVAAMLIFDPLAQTFTVNESFGVMLTGVKLRFKSKATDSSNVFVEIRPTVNGYPSATEAVPGTRIGKLPSEINISDDGTAVTTFEFPEPAYLMGGGTEYAIVVISDSNEYEIAVAEAGAFKLGSTDERVTSQPTLGTLFKSQNARTWEPDQTKDMTFELMRAKFNTQGNITLKNARLPSVVLPENSLSVNAGSSLVKINYPQFGVRVNDAVKIENVTGLGGLTPAHIEGVRSVHSILPNGKGFYINADVNATNTAIGGGRPKISDQVIYNIGMFTADNIIPDGTQIDTTAQFKQNTAGTPWSPIRYVELDKNIVFDNEYICLRGIDNQLTDNSVNLTLSLTTVSDFVSPIIDLQRINFAMIKNRISANYDVVDENGLEIDPNNELSANSGISLAKHITRVTTLADTAVDLKILLSAHKPADSNFEVYYRTNQVTSDQNVNEDTPTPVDIINDQNILNNPWIRVEHTGIKPPSDENPDNYREYSYITEINDPENENEIYGKTFNQFQVKIVMTSDNTSKVPMFKDLRVIALYD